MDKSLNVMNAGHSLARIGLGIPGKVVVEGSGTHVIKGPREVERRSSSAAPSAIERLVLLGGSAESNPALERRARLIATDMYVGPHVIRLRREDDVSAMTKPSDLVMIDRKKPLPFIAPYLGRAARRLLRESRAPVLVVAGMPAARYERVVVATDLATDIGGALAIAKRIAPNASFTVLHVYRALFDGKLQWAGVPDADIADYRIDAQREAALGMATLLDRHRGIGPVRTLLRYGWPVPGVVRTAAELDADLIVVVRNSRSWWADALGASISLELAQRAHGDVLVAHAPGA
jgi:nucleotide-binding universal stress UspA family protein